MAAEKRSTMTKIVRQYWRFRWWLWDQRDARLANEIFKLMQTTSLLYVHKDEESPATYAITHVNNLREHPDDHSHIEGKRDDQVS
jgi:hypothetical protein